jgi:hypothetical protein
MIARLAYIFVILTILPGPRAAAATRFVYALSGMPAAGVKVEWTGSSGSPQQEITDLRGGIRSTVGRGRVTVTDPKTSTILLSQGYDDLRETVVVGVPIRLTGTLSRFGDDPTNVEIDCGYDEPIPVSDYERSVQNMQFMERPDENKVYGLDLPRISPRSVRTRASASGAFTTQWFAATGAVQLLAFNPRGQMTVRSVTLSRSVQAGRTIRVSRLQPDFGATLEVTLNVPKTDLPLGLLMGVEGLEANPGSERRTAEILSVLHHREPELSQWLIRRRRLPLSFEATSSFVGLPPLKSLRLSFEGPVDGIRVERTVSIPDSGVVKISLDAEELLGRRQPHAALSGIVRFENDGPPIANATVVFSSYPDRRETRSGPDGRFTIPDLVEGRGGTLLIDAPYPDGEPPFDRVTSTVAVPAVGGAKSNVEQVFEVPKPPPRGSPVRSVSSPPPGTAAIQPTGQDGLVGNFQPINWNFLRCGNNYTQDELEYVSEPILTVWEARQDGLYGPALIVNANVNWASNGGFATADIQFAQSGTYVAILEYTPFVYDAKPLLILDGPFARATFQPAREFQLVQVNLFARNGARAPANVEISFPGWSPEPSPYTADTDGNGGVTLACVSRWPYPQNYPFNLVTMYINDPVSGYFAGGVDLPPSGDQAVLNVRLGDPPGR